MEKTLVRKLVIGFIVGAFVGTLIRHFRGVEIAPFIGGLSGLVAARFLNQPDKENS